MVGFKKDSSFCEDMSCGLKIEPEITFEKGKRKKYEKDQSNKIGSRLIVGGFVEHAQRPNGNHC
jgi:hypothetical protein